MKVVLTLIWTLVIFGVLVGGLIIGFTFKSDMNAIQQTSGFALGIACAVLPYCLARAFSEIFGEFANRK